MPNSRNCGKGAQGLTGKYCIEKLQKHALTVMYTV